MRLAFIIFIMLLGCTPKSPPQPQSESISIQVACPKEQGFVTTPQTVQCECRGPAIAPSGGLLNVLAGAIGFFVRTFFE